MSEQNFITMPIVVERTEKGERSYDLPSRLMNDRIIFIDSGFNTQMAHVVKMQLLYLDSVSAEPITIHLSSPGGSVHDGLGIADVVHSCRSPITVICNGFAASMGCYMLSTMGTPGMRFIGLRSTVMAHAVSAGQQGNISDMRISFQHTEKLDRQLAEEIAAAVGISYEEYKKDTDRDLWLDAEEALNYGTKGFVDGIITGKRNDKGQYEVKRRNNVFDWIG